MHDLTFALVIASKNWLSIECEINTLRNLRRYELETRRSKTPYSFVAHSTNAWPSS